MGKILNQTSCDRYKKYDKVCNLRFIKFPKYFRSSFIEQFKGVNYDLKIKETLIFDSLRNLSNSVGSLKILKNQHSIGPILFNIFNLRQLTVI